mgnify:CR=1 FL=1
MTLIRSIIFQCLFMVINVVLCIGLIWILVLPKRWAYNVLYYCYFSLVDVMERWILGLDYKVTGIENLPKSGSYIVAMKHQSAYETLKLYLIFGDIRAIVKKELLWLPLWGWYAARMGMIGVDRGKGKSAVESMLKNSKSVIDQGIPIVIYPQGTRVSVETSSAEKPYKYGAARLYNHYDIPIVPVALNSGKFWPRKSFLIKSGTVEFKILPPLKPGLDMDEAHRQMSIAIENESKKLL